jgi:GT2 family glycosyltransferase
MNKPEAADRVSAAEPEVTIIVVPRERFSCSPRSLESVYSNTPVPFRLIYVDGGSPARIKRYLQKQSKEKGFKLIRTERYLSPNQARNIGVRESTTKYVAFVDNDVEVSPGWLPALLQCAQETGAALVGPLYCIGLPVHEVVHMFGGEAAIREINGRRRLVEKLRFCDRPLSEVLPHLRRESSEIIEFHCMMARRDVFRQLGPLDERLLGTREHIDLCLQVRNAGGSIWLEPKAVATHLAPAEGSVALSEPLPWTDIPYYLLRWSDAWGQSSLRHFEQKWNLDGNAENLLTHWLRPHRQVPFGRLRAQLRRLLGAKLGDRLLDAFDDFLVRRAMQKGRGSDTSAASDAPAVQL